MIDVWGLAPWQLFPLIPGVVPGLEPEPEPPAKQIPTYIKLLDMCSRPKGTSTQIGYVLQVQYKVLDQEGKPIYGNAALNEAGAVMREDLKTVSGPTIVGGGEWCPQGGRCRNRVMSPTGTFWDTISGNPTGGAVF
jgi:hypothetical protein